MISFLVAIKDDAQIDHLLLELQVLSCLRVKNSCVVVGLSSNENGHFEKLAQSGLFQDPRVTLCISHDKGLYDGWNILVGRTQAEWVCFLGLGDIVMVPSHFDELFNDNEKSPSKINAHFARVLIPDAKKVRLFGRPFRAWRHRIKQEVAFVGAVFQRSLLVNCPFDTQYRIIGDYDWLLRNAHNLKPDFSPSICVMMPSGGMSEVMRQRFVGELRQAKKTHASR